MHLLLVTPLPQQIHPNLKEVKENLLPYAAADFLWAYIAIIMKVYKLDQWFSTSIL
jgi:hypothetical protein